MIKTDGTPTIAWDKTVDLTHESLTDAENRRAWETNQLGLEDEDDEDTYSIVRFHFQSERVVIDTGLSLEEAQEHCSRDDTHGEGWFDGYVTE